jgi:hypothetical protein
VITPLSDPFNLLWRETILLFLAEDEQEIDALDVGKKQIKVAVTAAFASRFPRL